jgi:AcrR family transcriptional regulator
MQNRRRTQAERRADTSARVLEAARAVFAERGYHAASLDLVGLRAGCTKGAIYDHFGSKEGLFIALLDEQYARRLDQARRAHASDAPSARLPFDREFALLFLEFVCAAARDPAIRRRLAARMRGLRAQAAALVGDERRAAIVGAIANGVSIEALLFGPSEAAETFDAAMALLPGETSAPIAPPR